MTKHLTPTEQASIISMYQSGEKVVAIAAMFKIHECTINKVIQRAGIPIRWYRNCGRIAARVME